MYRFFEGGSIFLQGTLALQQTQRSLSLLKIPFVLTQLLVFGYVA